VLAEVFGHLFSGHGDQVGIDRSLVLEPVVGGVDALVEFGALHVRKALCELTVDGFRECSCIPMLRSPAVRRMFTPVVLPSSSRSRSLR
jgi:hypothetical protein